MTADRGRSAVEFELRFPTSGETRREIQTQPSTIEEVARALGWVGGVTSLVFVDARRLARAALQTSGA